MGASGEAPSQMFGSRAACCRWTMLTSMFLSCCVGGGAGPGVGFGDGRSGQMGSEGQRQGAKRAPGLLGFTACTGPQLGVAWCALRGGGVDGEGDGGDVGFGHLDLNAADPNAIEQEEDAPWLKDAAESDEERELVAGMRQKLVLGQDKWYDDTMAAVPRNKQGAYDMHADEGDEDIFKSHQELLEEEENPEGYLGAVDEEGMKLLYPALKETYAYYARNMTLQERPAAHQFRPGDLVTISPQWRDAELGNYTSAAARGVQEVPEWELKGLHNDADLGPLRPDDVGVVVADDSSLKPYLVRALDSTCYKEGYPGRWVSEWWYIAEALVRWIPPKTISFAPDAEVRVPEDFGSVKLALKNMSEGQSLFVSRGEYRMEEALELGDHPQGIYPGHTRAQIRTLRLRGGPGARSWARMVFGRWANGYIHQMTLLLHTRNSYKATVEAHGGPWIFNSSVVRCAGGIALKCQSEANVTCVASELGGFAWPIGPNAASEGVHCADDSAVLLKSCTVDMTGRLGGVGVFARDRSSASLFGCVLKNNDLAVGFDDAVTVLVYNCTIKRNRNAAFYGGKRSMLETYLVLRCSRVDGPVWYRSRVPAKLGLTSEYPGDNIIGPLPPQLMQDIPGTGGKMKLPRLDDRVKTKHDFISVNFDGATYIGG